ncbi:hypothetical protein Pla52o_57650 [Novipirellula galeiformis]|uniref:SLA1 homology domain-containing protein n=1 Tax=Novipirellula galeiformis TaxID=2528004 RepID=A0A5C6BEZ1_9BACT|nr:SHD1 domain-containing protein [Novipirellula galeiformis]TWU10061.1 hypothetical protein Pla52o_57650 [Novipirellula galeiformis]
MFRSRLMETCWLLSWFLIGSGALPSLRAETWSDVSGKFRIEAKYVAVEGKAVVLEKTDGSVIKVPISRLSTESRAEAKRLYEQQIASEKNATKPESKPAMAAETATPAAQSRFAFPESGSLQQTVNFIQAEIKNGHPEVLWYALPAEVREVFDSPEFRQQFAETTADAQPMMDAMKQIATMVSKLLKDQQQFILNSQMLAAASPQGKMLLTMAYDPIAGFISQVALMSTDLEKLKSVSLTEYFDDYGPKIGRHVKQLLDMAPPQVTEQLFSNIQVTQTDPNNAVLTISSKDGTMQRTEMVRYQGRWISVGMSDWLTQHSGNLKEEILQGLSQANANPEMAKDKTTKVQMNSMAGFLLGFSESALKPLIEAKTQAEFDAAVMRVSMVAAMMTSGGLPNGN